MIFGALGCGGEADGGDPFAIYHLESAFGPPGEVGELRCGPPRLECPGVITQRPARTAHYRVLEPPGVEADEIDLDRASAAGALVSIPFTAAGTEAFARLSREVARVGGRDQGWHHLAVVVGDEIVAFPEIDYDDFPDGFPDAPAIRFRAASASDARDLVRRLRGN